MTQRVFDIENEEDMQDLWDILPDEIVRIFLEQIECFDRPRTMVEYLNTQRDFFTSLIAINWHDKTEITRPVNYEDMIGCVGWFWDDYGDKKILGILTGVNRDYNLKDVFLRDVCRWYSYFTPAKKSELKFYEELKQDE